MVSEHAMVCNFPSKQVWGFFFHFITEYQEAITFGFQQFQYSVAINSQQTSLQFKRLNDNL